MPSRPIERAISRGNFDVVHVHAGVGSPFAAAGIRVGLKLGLPVAVTVHCLPAAFRLPAWLTPWNQPEIAARVALNAVSEAAAAPLRARTGAQVTVVPNGLDPQDWTVRGGRPRPCRGARGVDHAAVSAQTPTAVARGRIGGPA